MDASCSAGLGGEEAGVVSPAVHLCDDDCASLHPAAAEDRASCL